MMKSKQSNYYPRDEKFAVPLSSNFKKTLFETSHGNLVEVKKYRPKSVSKVYRYADYPLVPAEHPNGKPTKASILSNITRANSATNICSRDSWIKENKRLCEIRYYYRDRKPESIVPRHRLKSTEDIIKLQNMIKASSQTPLSYENSLLQVKALLKDEKNETKSNSNNLLVNGKAIASRDVKTRGVNTDSTYFSLKQWHGAEWQRNLPKMYLPRPEKYDAYNSEPVRRKKINARFRGTHEMFHIDVQTSTTQ